MFGSLGFDYILRTSDFVQVYPYNQQWMLQNYLIRFNSILRNNLTNVGKSESGGRNSLESDFHNFPSDSFEIRNKSFWNVGTGFGFAETRICFPFQTFLFLFIVLFIFPQ